MDDWKAVSANIPNFNRTQKAKMMLSRETDEGLHRSISGINFIQCTCIIQLIIIYTVTSFCELAPKLLQAKDVHYLLSETFSQDHLEAYFSRQRHKGGIDVTIQVFNSSTTIQHH